MSAGNYNINAEQGSTFFFFFSYKDKDDFSIYVSSKTARIPARRSECSTSKVLDISGTNVTGPSDFVGTGGFTMNASDVTGDINIAVDATTMALIPSGKFFYDIELVDGATITKLIKGRFINDGEITR